MKEWGFKINRKENFVYFTIPSFEKTNIVKHCFTTRLGGVSKIPYNSLNLGVKTNDEKENILKNYELVCNELGVDIKNIVMSDQIHKDNVLIVDEKYKCNGFIFDKKVYEVDGLITNKSNITLITLYADCVPIFILDLRKRIIALAHAGWRGTVKKIGKKTIKKMILNFNTDPRDCLVGIGPSIGKCCYEVDDKVIHEFKTNFKNVDSFVKSIENNKYLLDLWKANEIAILEIGVPEKNITVSNICTKCNKELFFSHRGDNGQTGRMAAILQLL